MSAQQAATRVNASRPNDLFRCLESVIRSTPPNWLKHRARVAAAVTLHGYAGYPSESLTGRFKWP
jgi:hypothetical protein